MLGLKLQRPDFWLTKTSTLLTSFNGGQFGPDNGGQFHPETGGQFAPDFIDSLLRTGVVNYTGFSTLTS